MNIQSWFPLRLTSLISLLSWGLYMNYFTYIIKIIHVKTQSIVSAWKEGLIQGYFPLFYTTRHVCVCVCVRVCVCMCVCLDYFQLGETWYWSSASLLYFLYPNFPQNCLRVTWVFWVLCFALQRFSFFLPMRTYLPLVPFPCISATVLSIFIKLDKNIAAIIV